MVASHVFLMAIQIHDSCLLGSERGKLVGTNPYLEQRTRTQRLSELEIIPQQIFMSKAWFISAGFLKPRPPRLFGRQIISYPTILILRFLALPSHINLRQKASILW